MSLGISNFPRLSNNFHKIAPSFNTASTYWKTNSIACVDFVLVIWDHPVLVSGLNGCPISKLRPHSYLHRGWEDAHGIAHRIWENAQWAHIEADVQPHGHKAWGQRAALLPLGTGLRDVWNFIKIVWTLRNLKIPKAIWMFNGHYFKTL